MSNNERADIEGKVLQDVAAILAGKNSSGSVGYDALKEMCSSIIARSKDLLTSLWRTCKKKAWDQAPNFILRGICTLYPDVDLAFAIKYISGILRIPWKFSYEIGSFLAAKYP